MGGLAADGPGPATGACMKQTVLVTAGGSGIGLSIAEAFHGQDADVHVVDINRGALSAVEANYPKMITSAADVADESAVDEIIDHHLGHFGSLDVLVNCAGIAGPTAKVENISLADWRQCMAVNLDSMFLFARRVVPIMKGQGSGNIINISSTAGWHGYPLRTPYASSKWAVIGLTRSLAMELGSHGIRANVICPGSVEGDRMDRVIAAEAAEKGVSEEEVRAAYTNSNSLKSFINGNDIADMAVFLASEQASRVTGQVMNVDGHLESFG